MRTATLPLLLSATLFAGMAAAQAPMTGPRPNVILILADDLGWGDLGCYGSRRVPTPHLDSLAASGLLLTHFYQAGSVCSPSRAALLTGRYPARDSLHGHLADAERNRRRGMPDHLNPALPTLADALRANGYVTGHFGKWHLGAGPASPDLDAYGFDEYRVSNANTDEEWRLGDTSTQLDVGSPDRRPISSKLLVDASIRFLEANRHRPFYLNLWLLDVHATLNPSVEQMEPLRRLGPNAPLPFRSPAEVYFSTLAEMDRQVGRLLQRLRALGLERNTLVVFTSDNGPEDISVLNAAHSGVGQTGPFRGRKRSLYEGGIRVPFIARWPGRIPAGRVDAHSVVGGVDLFPTVCALASVRHPLAGQDGEDRSGVLLGGARERVSPLFWEWRFNIPGHLRDKSPTLAVREGEWKYLVNADGSREELYHLLRDPMELDNLVGREPAVRARLRVKVDGWRRTLPSSPVDTMAGRIQYPWPGGLSR